MATFRMGELPTTDVERADVFHSRQALQMPASTRNTSSESYRVGALGRVLRVLVVDAVQDSANAMLRQVRSAGTCAHAAPDGLAALRAATAWHPDVVLLDLDTPFIDGCRIAKHLRSDYSSEDCLIIAFAELVDEARRTPCMEAGINLLLRKPIDQDVVKTLLMLERVRLNRLRAREKVSKLNRPASTDYRLIYIRSKSC